MPADFAPILLLGAMAVALALLILGITAVIGPRRPSPVKQAPYESGMVPIGLGRRRFPVRYYLTAALFILFDVEILYLYPWAVRFRELARPAPAGIGVGVLTSMIAFVGVLLVGYAYVWRKGALRWD